MKSFNLTVFSLTIILFVGCKSHSKLKYNDPIVARADIVYNASPGLIPNIVYTSNKELLVAFVAKGDGIPGDSSQIVKSADNGKTWSAPFKVIKSDNPLGSTSTSLYNLPSGNWTVGQLLCYTIDITWLDNPDQSNPNWASLVGSRKFEGYYSFTNDNGNTFSERILLSDPTTRKDFAQGGIIELPNGELIWSWGDWVTPINGFKRSTDGGRTWGPTVRAFQDPPPGVAAPIRFNETAVTVCKDGKIIAIARVDGYNNNDKRFWQITSSDNGKTWSTPRQIEIQGGSPALYCTPKGQLWLAYRDGGVGPGLGLAVSDDNGENWRFLYHLREPTREHILSYGGIKYTDEDRSKPWRPAEGIVGYPCFAKISDTEVYIVFHAYTRTMTEKFPDFPFYIAGNLLRIPN